MKHQGEIHSRSKNPTTHSKQQWSLTSVHMEKVVEGKEI